MTKYLWLFIKKEINTGFYFSVLCKIKSILNSIEIVDIMFVYNEIQNKCLLPFLLIDFPKWETIFRAIRDDEYQMRIDIFFQKRSL